jgi:hypothetical protein
MSQSCTPLPSSRQGSLHHGSSPAGVQQLQQSCRHNRHAHSASQRRRRWQQQQGYGGRGARTAAGLRVHCVLRADYAATAADSCVLRRPLKDELTPEEVKNVFDYPRNLHEKCDPVNPIPCLHAVMLHSQTCMHACMCTTLWRC